MLGIFVGDLSVFEGLELSGGRCCLSAGSGGDIWWDGARRLCERHTELVEKELDKLSDLSAVGGTVWGGCLAFLFDD